MKLQINVKHYSTGEGCEFTWSPDGHDFNASPGFKVVPFARNDGDAGFNLWEDRPDEDPEQVVTVIPVREGKLCIRHIGVATYCYAVGYDVTIREADA